MNAERAEMREIAAIYKSKIIDLSPDSMVFELTGRPEKINAFLKMFSGYDILELCRTGITALERGGKHPHMQKPPQEVRAAQLPEQYRSRRKSAGYNKEARKLLLLWSQGRSQGPVQQKRS